MSEYFQGKNVLGALAGCRGWGWRPPAPPRHSSCPVPTGGEWHGGQSGRAQRETPCCRGHRAGLSLLLIHDFTFNLTDPLQVKKRPILQLTRLKGVQPRNWVEGGWGERKKKGGKGKRGITSAKVCTIKTHLLKIDFVLFAYCFPSLQGCVFLRGKLGNATPSEFQHMGSEEKGIGRKGKTRKGKRVRFQEQGCAMERMGSTQIAQRCFRACFVRSLGGND